MGLAIYRFPSGATAYKKAATGDFICRTCRDEENVERVLQPNPGQIKVTLYHCSKGHTIKTQ